MVDTELKHRLAAILAADAAGYSRLMAADERATLTALDSARAVFRQCTEANSGRVVDTAGDSVLAVFETATGAVIAALEIQRSLAESAYGAPDDHRLRFRIGVYMGDVAEKPDGTVYGDGVNVAARLQALAPPGGVVVSDAVRRSVRGRVGGPFVDLGQQTFKNIDEPVQAFAIEADALAATPAPRTSEIDLSLPDKPSIAVLPFTNMSGDPEQEYFTDGITEDILTELARFHELFVIARNSTFAYKDKAVDVRTVGRDLGVRYVLEGSIRKASNRVRVTAQLIDATNGAHLWAEKYDRELADIFEVQEEITTSIVAAIAPQVLDRELEKVLRRRPESLTAHEIATRARSDASEGWMSGDAQLLVQAADEARKALAIDERSALAWSALAFARMMLLQIGAAPDRAAVLAEGTDAANRALALDPSDGWASISLGAALLYGGRAADAVRVVRETTALNPNDSRLLILRGFVEAVAGDPLESIDCTLRAMRLSPRDRQAGANYLVLSLARFFAGDYANALADAQRSAMLAPNSPAALGNQALALVGLGRIVEARELAASVRRRWPDFVQSRVDGFAPYRNASNFERYTTFWRIADALDEPGAAGPA